MYNFLYKVILLLFLFLSQCGYQAIYNKENLSDIKITVGEMKGDTYLNNLINFNSIKVIEISRILMNFSLKKNKGKIINIGSSLSSHGAVFRAQGGGSDYSVTKSMVHIITKIMAYECAKFKINVNAIAPGIIQTPMHDRPMQVTEKKHLDKIPLDRIGLPKDISGTALFLGSNYSSYITGQIIHINGGMLMIG